jgi:hypothetical protein
VSVFPSDYTKALSALKDLPLWLLAAAAACSFVASSSAVLSPQYQGWAHLAGVCFSIVAAFRGAFLGAKFIKEWWGKREERRNERKQLYTILDDRQSFWYVSKQSDGSMLTQVRLHFTAKNLTSADITLSKFRLISPKMHGDVLYNEVTIRETDAGIRGQKLAHISPNHNAAVQAMIIVQGEPDPPKGRLDVIAGIADDRGREFRMKVALGKPE